MGLGYLGGLGNLDLGQLQDYPQGNNAPQNLVQQIRNSGSENFNSADEVLQAVQGDQ
jgi:hypothetical protein